MSFLLSLPTYVQIFKALLFQGKAILLHFLNEQPADLRKHKDNKFYFKFTFQFYTLT